MSDRIATSVSTKPRKGFGKNPATTLVDATSKEEGSSQMPWTVFNSQGQRKYLTAGEMDNFVKTARKYTIEVRSFCWLMAYTGCRISEALALTRDSIDFEAKHVIIKCLKKRGRRVFRAVPLPANLLKVFSRWFRVVQKVDERLWPWSRMTGYRRICEVMQSAGVRGSYASPKGLRHGFGVRAIQASVPLTLVQRWLGHADIKTTAIYTSAMGPEEREIAARMWHKKTVSRRLPDPEIAAERDHSSQSPEMSDKKIPPNSGQPGDRPPTYISASTIMTASQSSITVPVKKSRLNRLLSCSVLQKWLLCHDKDLYFSIHCSIFDAILPDGGLVNSQRQP